MKKDNKTDSHEEIDLTRRKALGRLGLAASAVYAAPVLMTLSQAHASSAPNATSAASVASGPSTSTPSTSAPSASGPSTSGPSATSGEPDVISSPSGSPG